jgi:phosphocarrier protein
LSAENRGNTAEKQKVIEQEPSFPLDCTPPGFFPNRLEFLKMTAAPAPENFIVRPMTRPNNPMIDRKSAMTRTEAEIVNKLGLHARASAKLTQLASRFGSDIWMERNHRRINAKSIMGVMMLAAGRGSKVVIEATGDDEDEAVEAILKLIDDKFGEGE